jgi:hypothetical protein
VASESADTRGDRNQVHPLRSTVTSVRGKANRHRSTRVLGSPVVLDNWRSRKQAARFQDLLQQPSHAYLTGRANAGYAGVTTNRKSPFVSMAAPLPILVSDPNGCLTLSKTRAHCGIRSTSKNTWNEIIKSSGIGDLGYRPFRGSDRFTAAGCVPKARASSLAQRDYR